ncbi:MAG: hypothetical protein ABIE70_00395 [bacterium]
MYRHSMAALLLIATVILAGGCSENPSKTQTDPTGLDLESSFGGYTADAEKAAFGDDELIAEAEANEGEVYDDPLFLSPVVDSLMADSIGTFYHFRALWGQLRCDSTVTNVTDWSGSLTVSAGVQRIRRIIHFELGQDYIPTRTDSSVVDWVSFTTVHNDGIAVDIYIPPTENEEEVVVTYATGPYTREFRLDDIASLDTIVYLDDADSNAIAFNGFRITGARCPRGFLSGHWGFNEDGEGVFRGVWLTRSGWVTGYLNGHYGLNDDGLRVFFGKWITQSGECQGLLRGTYGPRPDHHANGNAFRRAGGWFAGSIFDADEVEIGVLRGRYRSHPAFRRGFLDGRWKLTCGADDPGVADGSDGL